MALLVVVMAIWAVRAMRGLIRENEIGKFRRIVISILVSIIFAVSTCLTSYMSYLDAWNSRKNQLLQMGSCLGFYQVTKRLRSFRVGSDSWLLPWTSLAAIGVLFGIFARNQSAAWAILAALLISILCWLAKRCKFCARAFGVVEYNLSNEQARGAVGGMDSFIENVKSIAMGAFLSLGTTNGCLALAAYMFASALLFAITVRPFYERMREKDEFYSLLT